MAYIQLTLPNGELPFDGKQVTFRAPCDCGAPEGLQIGEQKFLIVLLFLQNFIPINTATVINAAFFAKIIFSSFFS